MGRMVEQGIDVFGGCTGRVGGSAGGGEEKYLHECPSCARAPVLVPIRLGGDVLWGRSDGWVLWARPQAG